MPAIEANPRDLLLPYQKRWAEDRSRFKIGCMARQTGKDFSSAEEIAEDMILTQSTTWMIAAPSERQSLESLDKVKDWLRAFDIAFSNNVFEFDEANFKATVITLSNGSRCIAVPGRPDTVRGYSANLLLTEFAFFDDPDATWKAILPSITNPLRGGVKKVRIISTPNGKTGKGRRFFQILDENLFNPREGRKTVWSCHFVTLRNAIAEGLPVDYEELAEAINDPIAQAQEMDLEFLDGCFQLLASDLITQSESPLADSMQEDDYWEDTEESLVIGFDFGRSSDPSCAWSAAVMGKVAYAREILTLRATSTPDQMDIMRPRMQAAKLIVIDYTGPGVGFGDYAVKKFGAYDPEHPKRGKVILCTFTQKFKRDIFPKLRSAMQSGRFAIPEQDAVLREDLASMQQIVKNGDYSYQAPRTAEGHADRCTAAALCQYGIDLYTSRAKHPPLPRRSRECQRAANKPKRTRKTRARMKGARRL